MKRTRPETPLNALCHVTPLIVDVAANAYAHSDEASVSTAVLEPECDIDIELAKLDQIAQTAKSALEHDRSVQIIMITDQA